MSLSQVAVVIAGLFLAGVVKGASGIGYSTFALPMLVAALDLGTAMAVITLPVLASNLAVIRALKGGAAAVVRLWPMYAGLLPGTAIGGLLFATVDRDVAMRLLGCVTLAYVGLAIAKPAWRLEAGVARLLRLPTGIATGVVTGMTGSQVVPLVPYVSSLEIEPRQQVQAINIAVTIGSVALFASLVLGGVMTVELMTLSASGVVPAIAGVAIGARIAARLSQQAFRGVMLAVLAVVAGSLIAGRDALRLFDRRGDGFTSAKTELDRGGWSRRGSGLLAADDHVDAVVGALLREHEPESVRPRSSEQAGERRD